MALTLGDNFSYQGAKPLDARLKYDTLAAMKAVGDATMYEGCMAYCVETDKEYQWKSTNTVDTDTGRWREFSSGSGGTSDYSDLENKPSINSVTLNGNKTSSDLHVAHAPTVISQILAAGSTTVTFGGLPASGNNLIDFYTSNGVNHRSITISGTTVVLTYPVQDSAITVYCRIEGV